MVQNSKPATEQNSILLPSEVDGNFPFDGHYPTSEYNEFVQAATQWWRKRTKNLTIKVTKKMIPHIEQVIHQNRGIIRTRSGEIVYLTARVGFYAEPKILIKTPTTTLTILGK